MDNPQKQVASILQNALLPPEEATTPEKVEDSPVIEAEESTTSETLETPEQIAQTAEEPVIDTLNNLAEELEIPIEDMYALNLKMPDSDPVSLGELKNFYLQNKDLDNARQELENEKARIQAESNKLRETPPIPNEMIHAQARVMMLQQEWAALSNSDLRSTNPGEYAARQQELKNQFEQAQYELNNVDQVVSHRQQQKMADEQQKLWGKVPDLQDESKRAQITEGLNSLVTKYGFSPEDLGSVIDHRLMHMLVDFSKLAAKAGNIRDKRIDVAPKVLKPQSVQNSQAGRKASLKRLTEKARESRNPQDKASAINALLLSRG